MSDDPDILRLGAALDTLDEHFDSVIIMATRHETEDESDTDEGTITAVCRRGNYYASLGVVKEWMIRQDEASRIKESE